MKNILVDEYEFFARNSKQPSLVNALLCYISCPTFRVIVLIRLLIKIKKRCFKIHIHNKLMTKYGIEVGITCHLGSNLYIPHPNGIVIGENVVIKDFCTIYQNVTLGQKNGLYPVVHDNVTIYPSSTIIGGITIGKNSVIGANSVVLNDVMENSIVAGNPGKFIKNT